MTEATLVHEGEQFRYVAADGETYEGELVWSWTTPEIGSAPSRTWPLTLVVRSIRATGPTKPVRLAHNRQATVAAEVKRILERREPGCEVRVVDTPDPVALRRPRRPRR